VSNEIFRWEGGFITLGLDRNGLPVLSVLVDDPFYSGVIDNRTLTRLLNALATLEQPPLPTAEQHEQRDERPWPDPRK